MRCPLYLTESVSYTHLDVYKRQALNVLQRNMAQICEFLLRQSFFLARFLYPSSQLFYQLDVYKRQPKGIVINRLNTVVQKALPVKMLSQLAGCPGSVSYTHLDVYKRQAQGCADHHFG